MFEVYYMEMIAPSVWQSYVVQVFDNYEEATRYCEGTTYSIRMK